VIPPDPFADLPNPALYVPRDASERALGELLACASQPDRPAALLAPAGHGKTLLLHLLAARLPAALGAVYVPNPALTPAELCAWTLGCLGSPPWDDPIPVVSAYAEHRASCGGALVWLVDDAQLLPEETARWLGHVVAGAGGAIRLVVAAVDDERGKALDALGALSRVDALAQPMERGETASYVFERLVRACVAAQLRARCKDALDAVHAASAGVPREVSAACSLLLAGRAFAQPSR
jgi:type II secretory pathway predicted ATPase ExeA